MHDGEDEMEDYDDEEEAAHRLYAEQIASQQRENNDGEDGRMLRRRYGIALKGTAMLYRENMIDTVHKAALKELILRGDKRVLAAVEVYEADHDDAEILDTLTRIERRGVQEMTQY